MIMRQGRLWISHAGLSRGLLAFPVAGIPGALGLAETAQPPGVNVAFASGDYYYLVGAQVSATASSEATIITAATLLYRRMHS